ncbi:hypothetical protein [Furfurilactobacillus entadae]|uniref:hypothetical protein n=1 Tax=Furfurilactobacillus entadae TaxID=2922307 RepID=UPI0035EA0EBE
MSSLLIPVSLFTKVFSYGMPGSIAELPFIFFFIMILFVASQRTDVLTIPHISSRVVVYVLALMGAQFFAIARSSMQFNNSVQAIGMGTSFVNIIGIIATVVLAYYAVVLTVTNEAQIRGFIKATIWSIIVLEVVVLMPQIVASSSSFFHGWVNLMGTLFESRWHGRDFYTNGSYATTLHRINGFEPEAGYLAGQIGLTFMPLMIAGLANHFDVFSGKTAEKHRQHYWWLVALFVVVLGTLFFAKTSTGFLVMGLSLCLLFWKAPKHDKHFLLGLAAGGLVVLILAYVFVGPIRNMLNQYIFRKSGTDNRAGGTIALFVTFFQHPFIGVGNSWVSPYLVENSPAWSKHNWEYIYVYSQGGYPILSVWGGWLAQFGLLGTVPVGVYLWRKVKPAVLRLRSLKRQNELIDNERLLKYIIDAFEVYLVMFAVLAALIFSWSQYYILLPLFFYIVGIRVLEQNIEN